MDVQPVAIEAEAEGTVHTFEMTVQAASRVYDTDLAKCQEITLKICVNIGPNVEVEIVSIPMLTLRHQRSLVEIEKPDISPNVCSPTCICSQKEEFRERGCVILRQLGTCSASTASYSPVSALPSLRGYNDWKNASKEFESMNGPMYL